jgi:four helix bundle protein
MHNFRELKIWQRSYELSKAIYKLVEGMSHEEKFGLKRQITRSAVSIPSNIAKGSSRQSYRDFHRFIEIAIGSSFELETQLMIASDLGLVDKVQAADIIGELNEIRKMINVFRMTLLKESEVKYSCLTSKI